MAASGNKRGFGFCLNHPWWVIGFFVVLTALGGYFLPRFEIDASAETLLVEDNRLYLESRLMGRRFSPDEFVLLAYRPHSGNIFSDESLADLQSLSEELGALERVQAVNSILNVPLLSQLEEADPGIDPQEWTWNSRRYPEQTLRRIFTDHPIFTELLVNRELSATALQIVFAADPELEELEGQILALQGRTLEGEALGEEDSARLEALQAREEARREAMDARRAGEIERIYEIMGGYEDEADLYLGGGYVLVYHLIDIITSDLALFGSAIGLAICLLLFLLFRDWRWVLIPLLCCATSVVITMGLFGALGLKTTVISSNFIALQLILTLALVIHLIVQYQVLAGEGGEAEHHALLARTMRIKVVPSFYAGLTTSVGFASLLFSGIQPVISFGWMMIVAMAVTLGVSLLLFPAILALSSGVLPHRGHAASRALLEAFLRLCRGRPALVGAGALVLILLSVAGMLRLEVENSFLNYFRESTVVRQELLFIDRELGGSTPLDVVYSPPAQQRDPELVASAETIQTLQRIQASLQSSRAVGDTLSVVDFTELARQLNDGRPLTEYELNSLYALLDAGVRENLVGSYFNAETGQFRISARIVDSTEGFDRAAFLAALRETMGALGIAAENYSLTNLFVLYQDILQRLFDSQLTTIGLVYLALGLVLLGVFRSPRVALTALAPNVLVTLFVLGLMGWLGIALDLMTITIAAIALGIAVDDTIHFVHHYRARMRDDPADAARSSFHSVGYAMLYTSLIIALGFSILGFSDFMPSVYFGLLTAAAMLIALLTDLTVLPVLLERYVNREKPEEEGDVTAAWHGN